MKTIILTFTVMALFTIWVHASSVYPPIGYLASELGVGAGAQLPKGIVYNGRPFFFYIVGAQERANGRYIVELQAR